MCGLAGVATFKTALATVATARRVLRRAVLALVAVLPGLTTPPAAHAQGLRCIARPCPRTWCKKDCLTRPPVARGAPGVAQRAAGGFQGGHR
jgi:hypothetical protein